MDIQVNWKTKQIQEPFTSKTVEDFQEQINKLQLDVLKETINVLKKTPALT
jgi:hypothetical protein